MSSAADTTRTPVVAPAVPRRKLFKFPPLSTVVWDWGLNPERDPEATAILWGLGLVLGLALSTFSFGTADVTLNDWRKVPEDSVLMEAKAHADRQVLLRRARCVPCVAVGTESVTQMTDDDKCLSRISP